MTVVQIWAITLQQKIYYNKNMKDNIFGKKLNYLRTEKGLTQKTLGKALHVSQRAISYWEDGSREPNIDTVIIISLFFNVTVDYLLGNEDD